MKQVLLLGAGLVARPLVRYLLDLPDYQLNIATRTVSKADALIEGHPRGVSHTWTIDDMEGLDRLVQQSDLAVSLLPATHHVAVAERCIKHQKHMVTTSYVSPAMEALDDDATAAGILLLNEIGVDPGIDHMSAMKVIDEVKAKGGRVVSFRSYCGGLPAPDANTNPWGYKFSWSPRAVVVAVKNSARYLRDGVLTEVRWQELFSDVHALDVEGPGELEAYPNRDSMGYVQLYGLEDIRTMYRGTLRYPGWCACWKKLVDLGYLDDTPRDDLAQFTYATLLGLLATGEKQPLSQESLAQHLEIDADSNIINRFVWLGLLADDPLPMQTGSPMDVLTARLSEKLWFAEGERDMIALHHEFIADYGDRSERITSTLVDYGQPAGDTAMARTVSLPAAMASRLILDGEITETGVRIPVSSRIYNPVLAELERNQIACIERFYPLS